MLNQKAGTVSREMIAQCAYKCVHSNEVLELIKASFTKNQSTNLWKTLKLIARPVHNSRLVKRIAHHVRNFRNVKIQVLPSLPKTTVDERFLISIATAWSQLCSGSPRLIDIQKLKSYDATFKSDCARDFGAHAEVQLLLHYDNSDLFAPSIYYFGCSKKSCFLCEVLLRNYPRPIATRGRHGICYPQWGVPFVKSKDILESLHILEETIVN